MKLDSHGAVYFSSGPTIEKVSLVDSAMVYSIETPGFVRSIAIDEGGNLYALSGSSPAFPVTPGAYKTSDNDPLSILKFDAQGKLLFTSNFDATLPIAFNGSIVDGGFDIAVDPAGNIVFTGVAGSGFPVTNDPEPQLNDCDPSNPCMAYVAALDNSGSTLRYARLLGHGRGDKLAFDPNGDVYVAGDAYGGYFPRTFDAFHYCNDTQPSAPSNLPTVITAPNGFVTRLDSKGQRKFSSLLGTGPTVVSYLQFTASGSLYISGFSLGSVLAGAPGYFVSVIDTTKAPRVPHACLVNATQNVGDSDGRELYVAPGQMVTLFGEGLGPEKAAPTQWNPEGSLSNSLAGVQVLFDGIPAPILYAQANQVNCIVPFGIADHPTTTVVVQYAGDQTDPLVFHVASDVANPFTNDYLPGADLLAINEDGTMNSAEHPAQRGSIITFFATGLGQTNPPLQDGQIASGAARTTHGLGGIYFFDSHGSLDTGQILYQGAAPGEVAGIYQLNVRIPADAATGHTLVRFDGVGWATEGIWLQ